MQLDKCKSCAHYIKTAEYDNGVFYGCEYKKALNLPCNTYEPLDTKKA